MKELRELKAESAAVKERVRVSPPSSKPSHTTAYEISPTV